MEIMQSVLLSLWNDVRDPYHKILKKIHLFSIAAYESLTLILSILWTRKQSLSNIPKF